MNLQEIDTVNSFSHTNILFRKNKLIIFRNIIF